MAEDRGQIKTISNFCAVPVTSYLSPDTHLAIGAMSLYQYIPDPDNIEASSR